MVCLSINIVGLKGEVHRKSQVIYSHACIRRCWLSKLGLAALSTKHVLSGHTSVEQGIDWLDESINGPSSVKFLLGFMRPKAKLTSGRKVKRKKLSEEKSSYDHLKKRYNVAKLGSTVEAHRHHITGIRCRGALDCWLEPSLRGIRPLLPSVILI